MARIVRASDAELNETQARALAALKRSAKPMSAYEVLGALGEGRRPAAPPTAYRALNRLIELGLVHRLESLNAYVACDHPHGEGAPPPVFSICDDCKGVTERVDQALARGVADLAAADGFSPASTVIEVHGRCGACQGQGA